MAKMIEGSLNADGLRFSLVTSRFNEFVSEKLLEGATDCLLRHGVADDDLTIVRVPGCFEIPLVAGRLAASGRFDAVLGLGVLIRGETPHFDFIAACAAKGLAAVAARTGVPVLFGIVTADTLEQAINRAGGKAGNKGVEAAMAALEMANLMRDLPGSGD